MFVATGVAIGLLAVLLAWYTSRDYSSFLASLRAPLVSVDDRLLYERDGRVFRDITLSDANGFSIRGRSVYPAGTVGLLPAIVVLDGASTGRYAVNFIPSLPDVIVLAIDYPYDVEAVSGWRDLVADIPAIRRAIFKTIAAAVLVNDYLDTQTNVHPTKRAIVGYSFGGPLTPAVMRVDPRYSHGAVAYSGGDIGALVAVNLRTGSDAANWFLGRLAGILLVPVEPLNFVSHIAPRPFLMINGLDDSRMPRANAELLFERAGEPKTIMWMDSKHVAPGNEALTALVLGEIEDWLADLDFFQPSDSLAPSTQ